MYATYGAIKQDHLCLKHLLLAWRHQDINWSNIVISSGIEINQSKNCTHHSVRQWASSMTTAQHRFENSVIRHTRIALGSTALSGVLRNTWPSNTSENNIENYQWRLKCGDIRWGMAISNWLICQKTLISNNVQLFQICTLQWRRTSCVFIVHDLCKLMANQTRQFRITGHLWGECTVD